MKQLSIFVLLVPVIVAITASSASRPQNATEQQACTESCGSMPKVAAADSASNPEMQRLERAFAGTWRTSESFAHNEFYPNVSWFSLKWRSDVLR